MQGQAEQLSKSKKRFLATTYKPFSRSLYVLEWPNLESRRTDEFAKKNFVVRWSLWWSCCKRNSRSAVGPGGGERNFVIEVSQAWSVCPASLLTSSHFLSRGFLRLVELVMKFKTSELDNLPWICVHNSVKRSQLKRMDPEFNCKSTYLEKFSLLLFPVTCFLFVSPKRNGIYCGGGNKE